jgi:hypothetical protein
MIGLQLVQSITKSTLINYLSCPVQALPLSDIHKRGDLKCNLSENGAGKKGEPCLERADSCLDASMVTIYHRDPLILDNKLFQETTSGLLLNECGDFFKEPEMSWSTKNCRPAGS